MRSVLSLFLCVLLALACSCEDDPIENKDIEIIFNNTFKARDLELDTETYQNSAGESFSIRELKYIISNIELVAQNGEVFSYPVEDSYFLINEEDPESQIIRLRNVPGINYQSIRFGIGVDQSNYPLNGVDNFVPTAEENQMLWSWSAGYIFFKMEGSYSVSGSDSEEDFLYHIGSHGTNLDNYKEVEITSSAGFLELRTNNRLFIEADVSKVFNASYEIRINDKPDIQIDPVNAPKISENVSQMFSIAQGS